MRILILTLYFCTCHAVRANCPRPPLENGFLVPHLDIYDHNVSVLYGCDTGFKPALESWWGEITCANGTWSHTPQCIGETWCLTPHVPNAEFVSELTSVYPNATKVSLRCNGAYEAVGTLEAECVDGKWTVPECKRKRSSCSAPPRVPNTMIKNHYKDAFEHNERLYYVCANGHKLNGYEYNICNNGEWKHNIRCEKITCSAPVMQNADPVNPVINSYNVGERVEFRCRSSYELIDTEFAECVDGWWRLPVCKPQGQSLCRPPSVANAVPLNPLAPFYLTGRSVEFKCDKYYEFKGTSSAVCEFGHWKLPVCNLFPVSVSVCGAQLRIENGDVTELPGGKELKVQCKTLHKIVGPDKVRCVAGEWTELPVCKPPCKLDRTRFLPRYPDKYLQEGEQKRFNCNQYYYDTIDIRCVNGQLIHSSCTTRD